MMEHLPPVFDELEESVLLFDRRGDPIDQNAAAERFLGYSDEELTSCTLETLVPDETDVSIDEIRGQLERVRNGDSQFFEWQIRRSNDESRWVLAALSSANFATEPQAIVEIRDLTRYKAQGRRLQLLYRVLRHNLRNDMTVIQGYATNLERAIEADDLEEQISVIKQTAQKVGGLSESVANLERLVEKDATERRQVDVTELVTEVIADVREKHPEISVATAFGDDLVISADEGLKLAVEHTLDNAIRHNDAEEPMVEIETTADESGSYVRIRISDNGPGIPEMELNALEGDVSQVEHGNSLGLWLIKSCTESLGGSVSFEGSETGTYVTLNVPRIQTT